jgi:hypothetical protein
MGYEMKILIDEEVVKQALRAIEIACDYADDYERDAPFFVGREAADALLSALQADTKVGAPTPPTNTYTAIHRYTGTGDGPPPIPPLDGGIVITKEVKPANTDELERERVRLAACGCAALGYFDGCHEDYKSASLDDVLSLRAKCNELREAARAVVEWWCDNGGDPLDIRIDRLRKTLK